MLDKAGLNLTSFSDLIYPRNMSSSSSSVESCFQRWESKSLHEQDEPCLEEERKSETVRCMSDKIVNFVIFLVILYRLCWKTSRVACHMVLEYIQRLGVGKHPKIGCRLVLENIQRLDAAWCWKTSSTFHSVDSVLHFVTIDWFWWRSRIFAVSMTPIFHPEDGERPKPVDEHKMKQANHWKESLVWWPRLIQCIFWFCTIHKNVFCLASSIKNYSSVIRRLTVTITDKFLLRLEMTFLYYYFYFIPLQYCKINEPIHMCYRRRE